ncbi:hypothetical protein IQ22_01852 [Pseudomonas duriflava]|uniref:Uncharacterized protein n=1 Tax=Pseudomonas duriflava TaxID=459528 RepID=A0A562QFY5_9PSED|nr:hypothetical protein IQ22_01852 [Pseudomonas duriflava]
MALCKSMRCGWFVVDECERKAIVSFPFQNWASGVGEVAP